MATQITTDVATEAAAALNINFRQMDCLVLNTVPDLMEFLSVTDPSTLAIILTHDCSISGDQDKLNKEPYLELILATEIKKPNSSCTGRQNPRTLHVEAAHNGATKYLELKIIERTFVDKSYFHDVSASTEWQISLENKDIIRRWLAARYNAPSYPSAYEDRLRSKDSAKGLSAQDQLKLILTREVWQHADGLYVIVEPEDEELVAEQPYELRFRIIVKEDIDADILKDIAACRDEIVDIFINTKGLNIIGQEGANTQELKSELIPIKARDQITLSEYNQFDLMLFDYLSDKKILPSMQRPARK